MDAELKKKIFLDRLKNKEKNKGKEFTTVSYNERNNRSNRNFNREDNHASNGERFVNPYHFVPIRGICKRKNTKEHLKNGKLTGWIEIELINKTPIFIPNSSNDEIFDHVKGGKSYEFFSYEDLSGKKKDDNSRGPENPVIPGSELRGVIRSAYETITNSCFSSLNKDSTITRRTVPFRYAGILEKRDDGWYLTECEIEKIKKYSFNYSDYGKRIKYNGREGYLFVGEKGIGNRGRSFYLFAPIGNFIKVPDEAVENFRKVLKDYSDETINIKLRQRAHGGYRHIRSKDFYLVFYEVDENTGKYYISPAQIGREAYYNKLRDILKEQGGFQPCDNKNELCSACLLFGFVAENEKNMALAGRVRFTDLKYVSGKEPEYIGPLYLKELASPKISAIEFYLKRGNNADYWNYDYAIRWLGGLEREYIKDYTPQLLGRKYYWHNLNPSFEEDRLTERHVRIRPLLKGHKFRGKIYYERLTEEELSALLYVINLGLNENNEYGHKIGKGKPYGLGSVLVKVTKLVARTLDYEDNKIIYGIKELNYKDYIEKFTPPDEKVNDAFKRIHKFNHNYNITYPKSYDGEEIFLWFVNNRRGINIKVEQSLTKSKIKSPYLIKNKKQKKRR